MSTCANAPTWDRGAAEQSSAICTTKYETEDNRSRSKNQDVVTFIESRERMLWRTLQLAIEVDLIEATPESKTLRTIAFREFRHVYVDLSPWGSP